MSATLVTEREQTARIARLNDLARKAMGVACTAVATVWTCNDFAPVT